MYPFCFVVLVRGLICCCYTHHRFASSKKRVRMVESVNDNSDSKSITDKSTTRKKCNNAIESVENWVFPFSKTRKVMKTTQNLVKDPQLLLHTIVERKASIARSEASGLKQTWVYHYIICSRCVFRWRGGVFGRFLRNNDMVDSSTVTKTNNGFFVDFTSAFWWWPIYLLTLSILFLYLSHDYWRLGFYSWIQYWS